MSKKWLLLFVGGVNLDPDRFLYQISSLLFFKETVFKDQFIKKTNKQLTDKPITSLNWSPDKAGLLVTSGFDQKIRVIIVTGVDPDK